MNRTEFFQNLKDILRSEFGARCVGGFDDKNLALDYGNNTDGRIKMFFELIGQMTGKILLARDNNDQIAIQAALIHVRVHAISLSTLFNALADDIETLLLSGGWPEIPENYRLPE